MWVYVCACPLCPLSVRHVLGCPVGQRYWAQCLALTQTGHLTPVTVPIAQAATAWHGPSTTGNFGTQTQNILLHAIYSA